MRIRASSAFEAEEAPSFMPRQTVVDQVEADHDQTLCGAGAPPWAT
ncbi:MAG: hypothetical protein ABJC60_09710 [Actinomycetota bacterium]